MTVQREIQIAAARKRVWSALTGFDEFCKWFGCKAAEGSPIRFEPGLQMELTYSNRPFAFTVIEMSPEHTFSWEWHPGTASPSEDCSGEPNTRVTFRLVEEGGATTVTVIETGFDLLSAERRAFAFPQNDKGWVHQLKELEKYLSHALAHGA